ncbi:unnamed protein product, partial [Rotaria socialis]
FFCYRSISLFIYFRLVPYEFGRNTLPIIKTIQQLKHEIELLEALHAVKITFTTSHTGTNTRLNPID